ncbi:hypothetical protein LW81_098 [Lactococcus phage LW81]|uniref:Uncharacterized protein n=1 Tax=Lactococcus phage LW81 TaxID=1965482 RepID=A0A1W6JN78_9CAUD|nr:hypothetical protein H1Z34_gp173 [Lactococcus phage LW81]ARM67668.1 hypothetical protein LW81_098 [Lactococcus phage LW81]
MTNPILIKELSFQLKEYRDILTDIIKLSARSDDQANSAKNILFQIFYHTEWMIQMYAGNYEEKPHGDSEDLSFKEGKVSQNIVKYIMDNFKGVPITEDSVNKLTQKEKEFLKPFEDLLSITHRMIRAVVDYSDSHSESKTIDRTDAQPISILYFIDSLKERTIYASLKEVY